MRFHEPAEYRNFVLKMIFTKIMKNHIAERQYNVKHNCNGNKLEYKHDCYRNARKMTGFLNVT